MSELGKPLQSTGLLLEGKEIPNLLLRKSCYFPEVLFVRWGIFFQASLKKKKWRGGRERKKKLWQTLSGLYYKPQSCLIELRLSLHKVARD